MSILHLVNIRLKVASVILTGAAFPALSTRSKPNWRSSGVRYQARVWCGVSGKKKKVMNPTGTVIILGNVSGVARIQGHLVDYPTDNV